MCRMYKQTVREKQYDDERMKKRARNIRNTLQCRTRQRSHQTMGDTCSCGYSSFLWNRNKPEKKKKKRKMTEKKEQQHYDTQVHFSMCISFYRPKAIHVRIAPVNFSSGRCVCVIYRLFRLS